MSSVPPGPGEPGGAGGLTELAEVMHTLRARCPWKAAQTHESLVPYLLEEAHEAVEAIHGGDPEQLRDELGDVLLQVYFHAVLAEEEGHFTLDDVARGVVEKMRRRNPHVYGDVVATTPEEATAAWEAAKRAEVAGPDSSG